MLRLEVLPARYGDCLWIEFGEEDALRRILIDGGAPGVYKRSLKPRLQRLTDEERKFELLVVTHVDYDHIRGIIELAQDDKVPYEARDVWFNGFRHIPEKPANVLAGKHGEQLTDLLRKNGSSWNQKGFNGEAVMIAADGELPRVEFAGDPVLTLTLMSPTIPMLADLRKDWEHSCESINITPEELEEARQQGRFRTLANGEAAPAPARPDIEQLLREDFVEDNSAANGSSIAFLAEYGDVRILFAADAHPSTLIESIDRLGYDKLPLTACKLPHHGSRGSVSADLIKRLDCDSFIFSSNGDQFKHPHQEAVARVIEHGGKNPRLLFNYLSEETSIWDDEVLREAYGYTTVYPEDAKDGIVLEWEINS
jgi:beta-lactamase superfamily II metal-dependent hydrolase